MYGSQSDSGNWDHMLDGTMESIMQMNQEPTELNNQQLQTSSSEMLAGKICHFRHRLDPIYTTFSQVCDRNMNDLFVCLSC